MRPLRRLLRRTPVAAALLAGALAAGPGAGPAAAQSAPAPTSATFSLTSEWGTGFVGRYVLHNGGTTPITGWRLDFDLPAGARLSSAWNAVVLHPGSHYVLTPVSYTRTIAPGASVVVGFEGTKGPAPMTAPTGCLFDGLPCEPDPGAVIATGAPAPTVPRGLVASAVTPNAVTLTWQASTAPLGVARYAVFRGTKQVATAITPTATVTGLSPRTTYRFSVRAVDAAGTASAASDPVRVTTTGPPPLRSKGLTATYMTVEDWGSGYVGAVIVRNPGATAVSGWQLGLDLPAGATLDTAWGATLARTPTGVMLTPDSWTQTVPRGGIVYVGFEGTADGPFPGPAACTIDGHACAVDDTVGATGGTPPVAGTATRPVSPSKATPPSFAPYVDLTLPPRTALTQALAGGTIRDASLAFVVDGGGCRASWGGVTPLEDPLVRSQVAALRAAGGRAIVSFGGQANRDLAEACPTVDALAVQLRSVVDRYATRDLDFDVEGADETDVASLTRRAQAIAQLQAAGRITHKPIRVSLTLPVTPRGLDAGGLGVVRNAIANGVDVGTVNVMAMDYFQPGLKVAGRMGALAIAAATATRRQLAALYPKLGPAALWRKVGITAMLGINDNPKEIFTRADAVQVAAFARAKRLGRLAFWSVNRDAPCAVPSVATNATCSGVADPAGAFSRAFAVFGRR